MESKYCPWCMNKKRKTELEFSVIDDMEIGRASCRERV